jgi:hypothetical protein
MFRLILILLATIGLTGCAGNPDTFKLKGNWLDGEKAIIQYALNDWCNTSKGEYCGSIGDDGDSSIIFSKKTAKQSGRNGSNIVGPDGASTIIIYNRRAFYEWNTTWLSRTLKHELGHHFRGQGHIKGYGNVMNPCGDSSKNMLTTEDVESTLDRAVTCASETENPERSISDVELDIAEVELDADEQFDTD